MVTQSILIKAPIQTVYDCIVDFESYPQFLTNMKGAKINWCEDKQMEVTFKLNLIKEITYTLLFDLVPSHEVHWKLKTGEMMKANTGSWLLKAKDDSLTSAQYTIDLEFSLWVPKAITSALLEKDLPHTLKSFKRRVEKKLKG